MNTEESRDQRLRLLEDHIGQAIAESERNGELRFAPSYGKPLNFGNGYAQTPQELRMGYKMLKDAGVLPPEVQLMRDIEALQQAIEAAPEAPDAAAKRERIAALRQQLAMRLERLRMTGSL
ncbi:MAG: DUF1992 domain-containing protein [Pseudomonadota bacterium]|nr:DUF1992 domain-containing protein [Pseudomonadota bacterium]